VYRTAAAERSFCPRCGTTLFVRSDDRGTATSQSCQRF